MDCPLIEGHLLAYHLAALGGAERTEVEEHLVACGDCLRTYLTLKAHVDHAAHAEGPSDALRLGLRAAVQARFRPSPARRVRRWFVRPVPLYQGVAVAAVLAVLGALAPSAVRALRDHPQTQATQRVDTTRTSARSTTLY